MSYRANNPRPSYGRKPFHTRHNELALPNTYPGFQPQLQGRRQPLGPRQSGPRYDRSWPRQEFANSRFAVNKPTSLRPFKLPAYMTNRDYSQPQRQEGFKPSTNVGYQKRRPDQRSRITFFQKPKALMEMHKPDFNINRQVTAKAPEFQRTSIDFRNIEQRYGASKSSRSEKDMIEPSGSERGYDSRSGRVSVRSMTVSDEVSPQFSPTSDQLPPFTAKKKHKDQTPVPSESEQEDEIDGTGEILSPELSMKMEETSIDDEAAESIPEDNAVDETEETEQPLNIANLAKQYEEDKETRRNIIEQTSNEGLKPLLRSLLATEKREFRCLQMCPQGEVETRIKDDMREEHEKIDGEDSPELQMIKRYTRSSADTELKVSSKIRPPFILRKTLDYLFKVILPHKWKDYISLFYFIDDRLRSIRQDLNIIFTSNPLFRFSKDSITCYEYMIRFYILSINRVRTKERPFDERDIVTALSETLKTLTSIYLERTSILLKYKVSR